MLSTNILSYTSLGACVGVLAGLLGIGGGLVMVPALVYLFQSQGIDPSVVIRLAIGTSLGAIVMTALSSTHAHHQRGAISWPVVQQLTPGIIVGSWLGAEAMHLLPIAALKFIFGLFELLVAVKMGFGLHPNASRQLPGRIVLMGIGALIGFVSGIVGIGGGIMTVPFLVWCNIAMRNAVATSAACGIPISVVGSLGFIATGWSVPALPPSSLGYLYWPALLGITAASMLTAPLGVRLAHTLPTTRLSRIFSFLLVILGIQMLLSIRDI